MSFFRIRSRLCGAHASRTGTRSRHLVSRRVLCVEGLEGRLLLNSDACCPVVDPPAETGSTAAETVVESSSTSQSPDQAECQPTDRKSLGLVLKLGHLQQADHDGFGWKHSRGEWNEGEGRGRNPRWQLPDVRHGLREGRDRDRAETGVSQRADAVRAVVAIFAELGRTLGLDAGAGEVTSGFLRILGGDLSPGTVTVFGPFLAANDSSEDTSSDSGDSGGDSGGSSGDEGSGSGSSSGEGESNSGSEPYILTFDAWGGSGEIWVLEGLVTYEDPTVLTVVFDGVVTGSTSVESNGSFSYSITVPEGTNGIVTAQAFDPLGVGSNVVYDWIA